jgi:hypothetical protein
MVSPCGDEGELHYSGSAIKKQEGSPPDLRIANSTTSRHDERKIFYSQGAFAQEMTAEQRSACMGDYEKYCKGVTPGGGRIIACLAKETDKLTPACKKVLAAAEKK